MQSHLAIGEIQNFLAYKSNTNLIQSTYKLHLKLIQALYPCTLACSHINTKWIESFSAYKTNTNLIQSAYKLHLKLIQAMQPCALAGNRRNTICRLFSQHIIFLSLHYLYMRLVWNIGLYMSFVFLDMYPHVQWGSTPKNTKLI